jgi:hypothetical protein
LYSIDLRWYRLQISCQQARNQQQKGKELKLQKLQNKKNHLPTISGWVAKKVCLPANFFLKGGQKRIAKKGTKKENFFFEKKSRFPLSLLSAAAADGIRACYMQTIYIIQY